MTMIRDIYGVHSFWAYRLCTLKHLGTLILVLTFRNNRQP
jgi:hypothetical protein